MNWNKLTPSALFAFVALVAVVSPAVANHYDHDDDGEATVYIGHGVTGQDLGLPTETPVDVLVADALCILQGFEFGEFSGPWLLPAGTYNVKISVANEDDPCSGDPVIDGDVPFMAGETATVLAHFDGNGNLTASKFVNDLSPADEIGKGRVAAYHTANAPTVVVKLQYEDMSPPVVIEGFSPGNEVQADLPAGDWDVTIGPTTDVVLFGPVTLNVDPFLGYFVYAVGQLDEGSFTLIVNELPLRLPSGGGEMEEDDDSDDDSSDDDSSDDDSADDGSSDDGSSDDDRRGRRDRSFKPGRRSVR